MFKMTLYYIKTKIKILIFFAITAFVTTIFSIIMPYYNGIFIDAVSIHPNKNTIIYYAIFICILSLISTIISYVYGILNTKLKLELSFSLYRSLVEHIQKIPFNRYKQYNPTYLNQRINTDVSKIWGFFLSYFINIFIQAASIIILLFLLFMMNIYIFSVSVIMIPFYIGVYLWSVKPLYNYSLDNKEKAAEYFKTGNEQLELALEIKANSMYEASTKWLINGYQKFFDSSILYTKVIGFFKSMDSIISIILQILVLIIGGFEIINGNLTLGKFVVVNSYCNMLFQTIKFFFTVGQEYQDTKNSYARIEEIMSIKEEENGEEQIEEIKKIELSNVSYSYHMMGKEIITSLSLHLIKGNIYFIEGENGVGKTTLLHLILGLLRDNMTGDVYYNDISIKNLDLIDLRKNKISTFIQNTKSSDSTVLDNIEYWTGFSRKDILPKIKEKKLESFYCSQQFDVEQFFEKRLSILSGGERQKINILCTLLRAKDVLILDEPTSQMDVISTKLLCHYLESKSENYITIIVTHDKKFRNYFEKIININIENGG